MYSTVCKDRERRQQETMASKGNYPDMPFPSGGFSSIAQTYPAMLPEVSHIVPL